MNDQPKSSTDAEREIFLESLKHVSTEERSAFLDRVCANNPAIRLAVETLLKHHKEDEFMQPSGLKSVQPSALEKSGDRIGRYKLLQQIGEGGCGVVYMAEQEEPVRRQVALKVIKLGMDTKSVIARFEAERQALALMDHPNIAKVFDAGATEMGRPYFVMELVRGIKITEYCDQNNLSTPQRLGLFIQVCQAIQHAHQKGIIHRDIKPSNVLVTLRDGVPVPKVIDFGISKATGDQRLTDKTLFTAFEQFIGTPAYMSPEQAEMSEQGVDTRSDIYSMGVLLYELLTGQTPFDSKRLLQSGLDEIRRIIREEEPARPSTRFSTMTHADLTVIAKSRKIEPPKLIHLVRGDLDWIVMKALEKDRARRYETANGFAADIQRHLNNEAVTACPPGNFYKLRKLIRRNKLTFIAVGGVAAALLIGLGFSTWSFFKEQQARRQAQADRKIAETETIRSKEVAQFLETMLDGVGPKIARGRDTRLLREILDETAQRLDTDLRGQPEVEADLRETLGSAYTVMGDYTDGLAMHRQALELHERLYGKDNLAIATSLDLVGEELSLSGRWAEAEPYQRQALAMRQKLLGPTNLAVAQSFRDLGVALFPQHKYAEAESCLRQSLALRKRFSGGDGFDVAESLNGLALVLKEEQKYSEAEPLLREALAIYEKHDAHFDPTFSVIMDQLGWTLLGENKPADAEAAFRASLEVRKKSMESGHPDFELSFYALAEALRRQRKFADAEVYFREALKIARKMPSESPSELRNLILSMAEMLREQGKTGDAESYYREALALSKKLDGEQAPDLIYILQGLGLVLKEKGRPPEAEAMFRDELAIQEKNLGNAVGAAETDLATTLDLLGGVLILQGRFLEAEPFARRSLSIREKNLPNDWVTFDSRDLLGMTLEAERKFDSAEPLLLSAYQGLKQREKERPIESKALLVATLQCLVDLEEKTNRPSEVAEWRKKLAELDTDRK